MSPEDFTNDPKQSHPEVAENPEAMQPAEQVTLRHLLGEVTNKSKGGYEDDESFMADLHYPDSEYGAATITRFKDGASRDDPARLAGIHCSSDVGNEGDRVHTNYFILKTPDGLHIEKHSHNSNYRREMPSMDASIEEIGASALQGIQRINEMQEAQKVEDELGLSFVSEQEARQLLELLDATEPFEKLDIF